MSYTLSKIRPDDRRGMAQVRALLEQEGISLDGNLDYTCGLFDEDDNLAATGSSFGSTLRCFAVDRAHQGEGLLNQIVSHLVERLTGQGRTHLFVYTKVSTAKFFQDLGFYEIARVEDTLSFLENRKNGFARFCARLARRRTEEPAAAIVMNANCSVCWGSCQGVIGEGETLISTGTRNFKGRAGHRDSFVYLASAATVTASAIKGEIATADML